MLPSITARLNDYSAAGQWRGQNLAAYKNSIYGNLAVTRRNEQYTFYSNGTPITSVPAPDTAFCEEFIHFGLLSRPDTPQGCRKVLFLGGGGGGFIFETLKHPVKKIDYAELDPLLIKMLKEFPADITKKELSDPRVNIIITDGVRYVKASGEKYDAIFINLPYPSTLQLNRYYTKEFFTCLRNALSENGQVVLGLPGSLSYLNEELKDLNLCILMTLKEVFPHVFVIPGDENIYISSAAPIQASPQILMERLAQRNIKTATLDEFHVRDRLQKYWQEWFYETINKSPAVKENKNLTPRGVFYGISCWNSLFNPHLRQFFRALNNLRPVHFISVIILLEFILLTIKYIFRLRKLGVAVSIATTGFTGMGLNLIFMLSYQIFFGYVYHYIALLMTFFMAGLAGGALFMTKNSERIRDGLLLFLALEASIILFCVCSGLFITYINGFKEFVFYPVFYLLSVVTGFLVGAEFPLANKLYLTDAAAVGETAGVLYALDLYGAFLAALLVSAVLIPIIGVLKTCLLLAILKSAGLILYPNINPKTSS